MVRVKVRDRDRVRLAFSQTIGLYRSLLSRCNVELDVERSRTYSLYLG